MEPQTKKYLLFIFLGLCLTNALIHAGYLQQKLACSGLACFKAIGLSLLSGIFFFGLSFIGVLLARERSATGGFIGVLLAGAAYALNYAGIAFFSPYSHFPKLPLLLNFGVTLAAFVYTLGYALAKPNRVPALWLLLALGAVTIGSGFYTLEHAADGGCDGGTCAVVIIFLPLYVIVYFLLFLALFQINNKPTSALRGIIFSTIAFLISLGINSTIFAEARQDIHSEWADPMFLLPCISGAVFLTFLLKITQVFAPKEDIISEAA